MVFTPQWCGNRISGVATASVAWQPLQWFANRFSGLQLPEFSVSLVGRNRPKKKNLCGASPKKGFDSQMGRG
jgi:hypothetical protein